MQTCNYFQDFSILITVSANSVAPNGPPRRIERSVTSKIWLYMIGYFQVWGYFNYWQQYLSDVLKSMESKPQNRAITLCQDTHLDTYFNNVIYRTIGQTTWRICDTPPVWAYHWTESTAVWANAYSNSQNYTQPTLGYTIKSWPENRTFFIYIVPCPC
jgi:hypothetical protein